MEYIPRLKKKYQEEIVNSLKGDYKSGSYKKECHCVLYVKTDLVLSLFFLIFFIIIEIVDC